MRSQLLTRLFAAAALSLLATTPAMAQSVPNSSSTRSAAYAWEAGYLTLSAMDAAETIHCLDRHTCTEGNPIWGKHPSTGKIILTKIGLGAIHFMAFKYIADRSPKTALRAAQISAFVQGSVVGLNAHLVFR